MLIEWSILYPIIFDNDPNDKLVNSFGQYGGQNEAINESFLWQSSKEYFYSKWTRDCVFMNEFKSTGHLASPNHLQPINIKFACCSIVERK